jgi:prolyl oligopeptidase
LHPNGPFIAAEFGTIKDPEQFKALYAYSPYHRVKDGTPYPAILLMNGANDRRVDPANARKMAARLQAATTSGRPVLVQLKSNTGHYGDNLSNEIELSADIYAFLFGQLGMQPSFAR